MNSKTTALFALVFVFNSGCASIVSKSEWPVSINSQPAGANCIVTSSQGTEVGSVETPATVLLKAKSGYFEHDDYKVTCNKEGFQSATGYIASSVNGWYFGNFLIGGLPGFMLVDPITGAMWKLEESVTVTLNHAATYAEATPKVAMQQNDVIVNLKEIEELREHGLLTQEEVESKRKPLLEKL